MGLFRSATAKGASFLCVISITALIWLVTLNLTMLNPVVVKDWLRQSDVYSRLVPAFTASATETQSTDNNFISHEAMQTALITTFTPTYVQEQAEKAVDSVYEWLDGKTTEPTFTIPVNEKKGDFIEQLAGAIEPQVAALPICPIAPVIAAEGASCRPYTISPKEFATMIATESADRSQLLDKPLTQEALGSAQPVSGMPEDPNALPVSQLPAAVQLLRWLLVGLPVAILCCFIIIALVAHNRLLAFSRLSRQVFFSCTLTLLAAGVLVYVSANPQILPGFTMVPTGGAVEIFTPVVQKAISSIASQLVLVSGVVWLVSTAAWILCSILNRRRSRAKLLPPSDPTTTASSNQEMYPKR